jgi:hypothetical protein
MGMAVRCRKRMRRRVVPGDNLLPRLRVRSAFCRMPDIKKGSPAGRSSLAMLRRPSRPGAGTPFLLLPISQNGAPGGASGLRGRSAAPCDRGGSRAERNGFARPNPGRARLMRRGCEARHRDAAPPGAPPPIRRMNRADQHRCRKRHWHFTQRTRRPTFVLSDSAPIVGLFQEHLEGADIGLYRTPSPKLLRTRTRCASMWRSL